MAAASCGRRKSHILQTQTVRAPDAVQQIVHCSILHACCTLIMAMAGQSTCADISLAHAVCRLPGPATGGGRCQWVQQVRLHYCTLSLYFLRMGPYSQQLASQQLLAISGCGRNVMPTCMKSAGGVMRRRQPSASSLEPARPSATSPAMSPSWYGQHALHMPKTCTVLSVLRHESRHLTQLSRPACAWLFQEEAIACNAGKLSALSKIASLDRQVCETQGTMVQLLAACDKCCAYDLQALTAELSLLEVWPSSLPIQCKQRN